MYCPTKYGACRTVQDFVRAGILRPVQPTTAQGYTAYPRAMRDFQLDPASYLIFAPPTGTVPAAGTFAMRTAPNFASDAGAMTPYTMSLSLINTIGTDASALARLYYTAANAVRMRVNTYSDVTSLSFSAGSIHYAVGRWDAAGVYMSFDGTSGSAGGAPTVGGTVNGLVIGGSGHSSGIANSLVGPAIYSPTCKSAAWASALQTGIPLAQIVRDYLSVGDFIAPLTGDSTGYWVI